MPSTEDDQPTELIVIRHGANPDVPRPPAGVVRWIGSVEPTHATVDDEFTDTVNKVNKLHNGAGFDTLGSAASGAPEIQYFGRQTTNIATNGLLTFVSAGGANLVDLATPTQPAVITDGEYLLRMEFFAAAQTGKKWGIEIDLDLNGNDWFGLTDGLLDGVNPLGASSAYGSFQYQGPMPAGGVIAVTFGHDVGSAIDVFWWAWLTKLSGVNVPLA